MRPGNDRPAPLWWRAIRHKHHARYGYIFPLRRKRMIQNAKGGSFVGQVIFIRLLYPDQFARFSCRQRLWGFIEPAKWKRARRMMALRRWRRRWILCRHSNARGRDGRPKGSQEDSTPAEIQVRNPARRESFHQSSNVHDTGVG